MNKTFLAATALAYMATVQPVLAEDAIMISDAWVRSAPPGASVMAGYFELSNHNHTAVTLTTASSPQFKSVEIHKSYNDSGMMRMQKVDELSIDSHESVRFEPGSYHLMLIKPINALKPGDASMITLEFNNHPNVSVAFTVKKDQATAGQHDMGHGHKHH